MNKPPPKINVLSYFVIQSHNVVMLKMFYYD